MRLSIGRRALSIASKAGRRPSTALAHTSSPEFLDQRLSKSTLEAATTDATGSVWLRWSDGAGGSFHPLWLRDNCPSVRHAASRQKLVSAAAISRDLAVESVECEPERLRVRWHPDGHVSEFCAAWLRELGGSVAALAVYDMCKAASKGIVIRDVRLLKKTGGKSGEWVAKN